MNSEQYWVGKNIDVRQLWKTYESDPGFKRKFESMQTHLLEVKFNIPTITNPLFNHEVIFKTFKRLYHDTKQIYLPKQYDQLGPLFLYQVNRSSGIYQLLVETWPGLVMVCILLGGTDFIKKGLISKSLEIWKDIEEIKGQKLENMLTESNLQVNKDQAEFFNYMREKLLSQDLAQVRITKKEFTVDSKSEFIDFTNIDDQKDD